MSPKVYALSILGFCLLAFTAIGFLIGSQKQPTEINANDFYSLQKEQKQQLTESAVTPTSDIVTDQQIESISMTNEEKNGTATVDITAKETTTSCSGENCFEEKFKNCEPATITTTVEGLGSAHYTILGKTTEGCRITFRYLEVPNPAWENKDLTCTYNNKISFEASYQETFESAVRAENPTCSGPLYLEFKKMNQS